MNTVKIRYERPLNVGEPGVVVKVEMQVEDRDLAVPYLVAAIDHLVAMGLPAGNWKRHPKGDDE